MCKIGDIIVVNQFKDKNGNLVPKHSFVVISDKKEYIEGFSYDFVANVMCSFHSNKHKKYKLGIKSNLEIKSDNIIGKNINSKCGYIRADELFYFNKKKITYKVIARINDDLLDKLINLIIELHYDDNLKNVFSNL